MEILTATCRICAQDHKTVICTDDFRHNFKQILTFLTFKSASVQVEQTDKLPQTICHLCRQELLRTYRFLKQIEQSAQFLTLNRPVLEKTIKSEYDADCVPNGIFLDDNDMQSFQAKPVCKFETEEIIVNPEAVNSQFCNTNYIVGTREENELNSESDWRPNYDNEYEEGSSSLIEHQFQFIDVRDDISGKHTCQAESIENEEIAVLNDFQHTSSEPFTMNLTSNLLPAKSRIAYEKTYADFEKWRKKNNISKISEEVLVDFFKLQLTKYKVSSVLSAYTKLKSCLSIYCGVDISKYKKIQTVLKHGNIQNKANILEIGDIYRFISEADDRMYLVMKVILIMGYCGACKRDQLTYITTDDIKYAEDKIIVSVTDRKTSTRNEFEITERAWTDLIKRYAALRPKTVPHKRFLLTYRNGRCFSKTIGINSMGKVCKEIASFLKLPDPESYTGRCFRKSSTAQASKKDVWPALKRRRKSKADQCGEEILQKRIKIA